MGVTFPWCSSVFQFFGWLDIQAWSPLTFLSSLLILIGIQAGNKISHNHRMAVPVDQSGTFFGKCLGKSGAGQAHRQALGHAVHAVRALLESGGSGEDLKAGILLISLAPVYLALRTKSPDMV